MVVRGRGLDAPWDAPVGWCFEWQASGAMNPIGYPRQDWGSRLERSARPLMAGLLPLRPRCLGEDALQLLARQGSQVTGREGAVRGNDKRAGNLSHAAEGLGDGCISHRDRVGDSELLDKGTDGFGSLRVEREPDDGDGVVGVREVKGREVGDLADAWGAERGPEVEDDDLAGEGF